MVDLRTNPLVQLTLWRTREFLREPEAIFWVFAFPILLAFALGLAFQARGTETVRVAVERGPGDADIESALSAAPDVDPVVLDSAEAHDRLRSGRVTMVVTAGDPIELRYDSTRAESQLARAVVVNALQGAAGREDVIEIRDVRVRERGARYIDFLIPGLLGLNIMGTGLWGVGFGIARNRQNRLLKRCIASPMRKAHYLIAQMLARLVFLVLEATAVVAFGMIVFHVPLRGSVFTLALIIVLGAVTFAGFGLLVASRARTIEGVSGLMNMVMVPMWIGSGVFFAYSHFPDPMQPFLKALPLTALNDALRAVMLDGAALGSQIGPIALLVTWTAVSFGVALKLFRWQ
jgi:ABC-type multidrug transport system permease subunit